MAQDVISFDSSPFNSPYGAFDGLIDSGMPPLETATYNPSNLVNISPLNGYDQTYDNPFNFDPDIIPTSTSPTSVPQPSPTNASSTSSPKKLPKTPSVTSTSTSASRIEKRRANTLAARRYRQARLDEVSNLKAELKETQLERDALKVQVAKLQGETQVLKDLVRGDR